MSQKDWTFEEDELLSKECENCEASLEGSDVEDIEVCPDCGCEDLINSTCHEGMECSKCQGVFDIWEDGYRNEKNDDELICKDCFDKLADEEDEEETSD